MLLRMSLAAGIAALCLPIMASANEQHSHTHAKGEQTIVVSCFRGPWKEVIWDRPNAVFIDSLVGVGYDYATANAIGQRVCRDDALVGNPGALKATMRRILRNR